MFTVRMDNKKDPVHTLRRKVHVTHMNNLFWTVQRAFLLNAKIATVLEIARLPGGA